METIRAWRDNESLSYSILSYFLANDGLTTVVYFTSIYAATTLRFSSEQILLLFLIVQIVAVPATIAGGYLADRIGHRPVLLALLGGWALATTGFVLGNSIGTFYVLSITTGLLIGTTPSIYRALIANHTAIDRASEIFGFTAFASRASAVLGPILFGAVAAATGSQRVAMATLLVFFGGAAVLLHRVPNVAGQE